MTDLPFFTHEEQRFYERHERRHTPKAGAGARRRADRQRSEWEHALEAQADQRASEVTQGFYWGGGEGERWA